MTASSCRPMLDPPNLTPCIVKPRGAKLFTRLSISLWFPPPSITFTQKLALIRHDAARFAGQKQGNLY
jgi:hypothetical protein